MHDIHPSFATGTVKLKTSQNERFLNKQETLKSCGPTDQMPANRPDTYNSKREKFLSNIKLGAFLWGETFLDPGVRRNLL